MTTHSIIVHTRRASQRLWQGLTKYLVKFGVVGAFGVVLDVGIFNMLRLGVFGHDHWLQSPVGAKIVSVSVAIVFNWAGNRYWTFREYRRKAAVREFAEYVAVSVGGMLIALGALWVSHYGLGFQSLVADNIASNIVGLGLGTIFRFFLYRYWVWGHHRADGLHNLTEARDGAEAVAVADSLDEDPTDTSVMRK
jgi:putative flippase GtrA